MQELSTGGKALEEWTFLPKNWRYQVDGHQIIFKENFLMLGFRPEYSENNNYTGAHIILNLSSRKQFWIKRKERKILAKKIKEKIPDVDDNGNPRDFRRIRIPDSRGKITKVDFQLKALSDWPRALSRQHHFENLSKIKVGPNGIEMKYKAVIRVNRNDATSGLL